MSQYDTAESLREQVSYLRAKVEQLQNDLARARDRIARMQSERGESVTAAPLRSNQYIDLGSDAPPRRKGSTLVRTLGPVVLMLVGAAVLAYFQLRRRHDMQAAEMRRIWQQSCAGRANDEKPMQIDPALLTPH